MTQYVLPLEVIGLLLTAALIGAVIIAMKEELLKPVAAEVTRLILNEVRSSSRRLLRDWKEGGHS